MASKTSDVVELKGYGDSVNIIINADAAFLDVEAELNRKLADSGQFFANVTVVLDVGDRVLGSDECEKLKEILIDKFSLVVSDVLTQSDETLKAVQAIGWKGKSREQDGRKTQKKQKRKKNDAMENDTILIMQTFRSGQNLWHSGNVVIIGDVNPGAEIMATGDIVVMGALRGMAHAGVEGDIHAKIVALNLYPTQLRIAGYIGRSPDLKIKTDNVPEEARAEDGNITIRKLN